MTDDVTNLRELADTLDGCEWNHPLGSAELCRDAAEELERLRAEITSITEEHGRVWERAREQEAETERLRLKAVELGEQVVQQADEIERLKAIIAADDAYFAITARAAFKMIRGPLAESFHAEQAAVWEKCKSTRKAAEAAGGE